MNRNGDLAGITAARRIVRDIHGGHDANTSVGDSRTMIRRAARTAAVVNIAYRAIGGFAAARGQGIDLRTQLQKAFGYPPLRHSFSRLCAKRCFLVGRVRIAMHILALLHIPYFGCEFQVAIIYGSSR